MDAATLSAHPERTFPQAPAAPAGRTLAWGGAAAYLLLLAGALTAIPGSFVLLRCVGATLAMTLTAALLRRHPLTALALLQAGALAVILVIGRVGHMAAASECRFLPMVAVDLAAGYVVAVRGRAVSAAALGVCLLIQLAVIALFPGGPDTVSALSPLAVLVVAVCAGAGLFGRERRQHAAALRESELAEAVTAQRLEIAREMHDMVAHGLGIVALQSGAARRVLDTQPEQARAALGEVEAASREALAGLRRMLGALREADPDADPAFRQSGLDDIERLARAANAAGVRVELRWLGRRRALPAEIERSAFRIVQESLANVLRHADARGCRVSVDCRGEQLRIEVLDDGRGPVGAARPGYGLVGMRERVDLLHGRFAAGPGPAGGFLVEALLPVPAPLPGPPGAP